MKLWFKIACLLLPLVSGCEEDYLGDDPICSCDSFITTVEVTLTSGSAIDSLTYWDPDGPGGLEPKILGSTLNANTTYNFITTFANDLEVPREDFTVEIREEDEEHQVFYLFNGITGDVAYRDMDQNGNPIGLEGTIRTGDPGEGTLTTLLVFEPTKGASGVSEGDITNAGGETDIEIVFPVKVE